ncbi:hypothetical protein [Rhizobium johnstonii]|uniref:hypothetical protein n=1 Tax=Rhizobium johnstonii TaxID=3019933 RepID=UPI003F960C3C
MAKSRKKRKKTPEFELEIRKIRTAKRKVVKLGPSYSDIVEADPVRKIKAGRNTRRILPDLTADLSKYADDRETVMPGKTIRNEFRKYPWKNSSYDTVKG